MSKSPTHWFCNKECTREWNLSHPPSEPRVCKACSEPKLLIEFRFKSRHNLFSLKCKACENRQAATRSKPSKIKNKNHFVWYLNRHYKLSFDEYMTMHSQQGGLCAICRLPESRMGGGKRLAVDHCHVSGEVRGLLCHKCNVGLGLFSDKPENLVSALIYLGRFDVAEQEVIRMAVSGYDDLQREVERGK